ncbi:hypothetical protein [Cucumibacter marinus]|uniref:hypothetical protein n=1 Tax=Cucumibacter marinus TaxID=1121252 RepID=UPI000419B3EA|nr:hypothetical protein [Cucumibacter marinus]
MAELPEMLERGETARLFPVLADTSREMRMASIFLALLTQVRPLAKAMLGSVGQNAGKRAQIATFTEVVFKQRGSIKERPDGLLVISNGKSSWSALIEAKIGKAQIDAGQVERYLELAKLNGIDAVITISNEFVRTAEQSPVEVPKSLLRRCNLYHWSWVSILTQSEIMAHQERIEDNEQKYLLSEFIRLLRHSGTGVERFTQMNKDWSDLVRAVAHQGNLKKTSPEVEEGVAAWFEEERDLCLQLARHVGREIETVVERKFKDDPSARLRNGASRLVEDFVLESVLRIPDGAADLEIIADIARRSVSVGMRLKAPTDRKSTKARVNWLLRMLKDDDPRLVVRAHWPGRTSPTQEFLNVLRDRPDALQVDNSQAAPHSFEVLMIETLGKRFSGRRTFIEDLECVVPDFYDMAGQHLRAWQASPPRPLKSSRDEAEPSGETESRNTDGFWVDRF